MTNARTADGFPLAHRRTLRRDPRLPLADMFESETARQLYESLPTDCQVDHIDKKNIPSIYQGAIAYRNSGNGSTSCYINMRRLPESIQWELAWLVYREVELGRSIRPNEFNAAIRALRIATSEGTKRGRNARSILHLTPEEWIREVQAARMGGNDSAAGRDESALHRLRQLQDVLVYPYHQGDWWQLNVWNPQLDNRIPRRQHEPEGRHVINFSHLTSEWLREAAKYWLSTNLSNGTMTWSTVRTRLDNLKWLQRHVDRWGDFGPSLTADSHELRAYIRAFCDMLATHRIPQGSPNAGKPLQKNPRRQIMVAIERFYFWMYDHRVEMSATIPAWGLLRPEHTALFRPEDKPRLTNKRSDEPLALEDDVVARIAEGGELLARPRSEGGIGDLQAFHALMLLIRTGRRVNEVLMMDFDPLVPLIGTGSPQPDSDTDGDFVARLRYQQTKIDSSQSHTIPVDSEIVAIIRAQQTVAVEFMSSMGHPGVQPRYLFVRTRINRHGTAPYSMATMHARLKALAEKLALTDSTGRPVGISKTHRFRHTAATNLINAGVPLHVVMRYFGHVSPEMTLHYAITRDQTMEEEFLRYKKVTRDGRTAEIEGSDLYELMHLDKRADRVLPNGWCTLPPKQLCNKGNACLSCSKFVTDATHEAELRRQLDSTARLIDLRQEAFTTKYGSPMGHDNIWLQGRREEVASLNRILLSITDVTGRAVRGAGIEDAPKGPANA